MSEQPATVRLETAAVTDRGLNAKRPLNEDSFLLDAERRIFVVADGVGGAEAGEVASQRAVEVLDEAFRNHQPGDDVEDLMELAIQRANASIHQLAHEERHFSMMATTVVALHLDGRRATFGHVGDSRLYRLTPDGQLRRETEDHSIVEEEVRAGRMTAEQAAHHPSRNVISRALGAEASVEVDMQTIEVADGTIFLLCTDGITRHIPDPELGALLRDTETLAAACAELKRLCFERGAEDNLTAVAVRVGARTQPTTPPPAVTGRTLDDDEAPTVSTSRPPAAPAAPAAAAAVPGLLQRPFNSAGTANGGSRVVVPAPEAADRTDASRGAAQKDSGNVSGSVVGSSVVGSGKVSGSGNDIGRGGAGRVLRWLGVLLLLAATGAGAFYAGRKYQRAQGTFEADEPTAASVVSTPQPETPEMRFARQRHEVDRDPARLAQLYDGALRQQSPQAGDPDFLYLYGRALLLSGRPQEALNYFEQAAQRLNQSSGAGPADLLVETRIATAAAALQATDPATKERAARALSELGQPQHTSPAAAAPAGAAAVPTPAPTQ